MGETAYAAGDRRGNSRQVPAARRAAPPPDVAITDISEVFLRRSRGRRRCLSHPCRTPAHALALMAWRHAPLGGGTFMWSDTISPTVSFGPSRTIPTSDASIVRLCVHALCGSAAAVPHGWRHGTLRIAATHAGFAMACSPAGECRGLLRNAAGAVRCGSVGASTRSAWRRRRSGYRSLGPALASCGFGRGLRQSGRFRRLRLRNQS